MGGLLAVVDSGELSSPCDAFSSPLVFSPALKASPVPHHTPFLYSSPFNAALIRTLLAPTPPSTERLFTSTSV